MTLYVVGTGPGDVSYMSLRAIEIIKQVDCIAGYTTYINLIKNLVAGKQIISTGMTKEIERVEKAIDITLKGKSCALISGGDPGIYAMAGLVFEICKLKNIQLIRSRDKSIDPAKTKNSLTIEIVPGIPALAAGAALAGAPLTHDFAAISLSDLLTPWEKIEKRLNAAAMADFVIVIYNPKSKKRDWQIKKAKTIILEHRNRATPVAVVTGAMRENQNISFTTLDQIDKADIGMQTVLFIGSSDSLQYLDFLFTPRGYAKKYEI
jgi:precorrin-3B C17-methyltransferase